MVLWRLNYRNLDEQFTFSVFFLQSHNINLTQWPQPWISPRENATGNAKDEQFHPRLLPMTPHPILIHLPRLKRQ